VTTQKYSPSHITDGEEQTQHGSILVSSIGDEPLSPASAGVGMFANWLTAGLVLLPSAPQLLAYATHCLAELQATYQSVPRPLWIASA